MTTWEVLPNAPAVREHLVEDVFPVHNDDGHRDRALPSVDGATFRAVMGSFASGVCVVTTADQAWTPMGFTCSAVCSVSAQPPLLLSGVSNRSRTLAAVLARGAFTVNMLDRRSRQVSQVFASPIPDKFDRVRWWRGTVTGTPVLADVVAYAECELDSAVPAGDHTLLVGRVVGGGSAGEAHPLAYWRGGYAEVLR